MTYDYDAADRIMKKTYPDGTFETYVYNKLDLASLHRPPEQHLDLRLRRRPPVVLRHRPARGADPVRLQSQGPDQQPHRPQDERNAMVLRRAGPANLEAVPQHQYRHLHLREHHQPAEVGDRRAVAGEDLRLRQGRPADRHHLHRRRQPDPQRQLHLGSLLPAAHVDDRRHRHAAVHGLRNRCSRRAPS